MVASQASSLGKVSEIQSDLSDESSIVVHSGETLDFIRTLPSDQFKLIITSPPYNIGKSYEQQTALGEYLESQTTVIEELVRCLSSDGSLCWQVGNYVEDGEVFPLDAWFYPIFKQQGLKLRNRIVWHFGHGLHATRRFSGRYETLLWFTKSDDYVFNLDPVRVPSKYPGKRYYKGPKKGQLSGNPLGKNPTDFWTFIAQEWDRAVWDIPNVKANHPEKTSHPCQFPIELVERCVLAFTNEDDWVLDPYMGVGSSLIGGILHGRRVAGCDWDSIFVDIAEQRIRDLHFGKLRIRKIGTPVHKPTGREKVAQIPIEWTEGVENE